jgi:cytochrome c biogenesis protein CcdA
MVEAPYAFLVFLAGVATVATPCIIPILPPMLAGSVGHRLRPLLIVAGSAVTFTLMGGLFSALGLAVGAAKETLRLIFIGVIIAFGAVMVDEDLNQLYTRYSSALVNRLGVSGFANKKGSLPGAFILGMALGIVWIPCVGPILGSVLAYTAYQGELVSGSLLLLIYSAGLGLPMLAIAYGGKYAGAKLEWAQRNSPRIRKFAGAVLILTGLAMLFGLDKYIQAKLLPYFPPIL